MANLFVETGGNLSALTYKKVVSQADFSFQNSSHWASINGATVTQAVTPSEGGSCEGVVLAISTFRPGYQATPSAQYDWNGTITVVLQESVASVWTDRATATATGADVNGTLNIPNWASVYYFKFASAYTVDTTAGKWRLSITGTTDNSPASQQGYVNRNASSVVSHALVIATTTTFTSGDNLYVAHGQTFTIDQTQTFGTILPSVDTKIEWENPPAAAYTFTATLVCVVPNLRFWVGSEANPIPASARATLAITQTNNTTAYNQFPMCSFRLWGERPTGETARVATTTSAGASAIVVTGDITGWSNGDTLWIHGLSNPFGASVPAYARTISSISGQTINLGSSMTQAISAGSLVLNITHADDCGIYSGNIGGEILEAQIVGVKITSGNASFGGSSSFPTDSTRGALYKPFIEKSVFIVSAGIGNGGGFGANYWAGSPYMGVAMTGCVYEKCYMSYVNSGISQSLPVGSSLTMSNCLIADGGFGNASKVIASYNSTISDVDFYSRAGGSAEVVKFTGANVALSNIVSHGQYTCLNLEGFNISVNTAYLDKGYYSGIRFGNGTYTLSNIYFGTKLANLVDIENTYAFYQATATGGNTYVFETETMSNSVLGSYIKQVDYNATTNDDRTFWKYGKMQRTGDGLTDTTVRTSGTGKFALRFEPTSSTNNLTWDFTVPTGDIQTKTMTVFMWVKINSATYYAGTHQLPRLSINYDNGTTAYAQAAENTDWQLVYVAFTPTTTYGQITVTVSGRTDATSTNAYFYVDDFGISYPPNVALDLGGLDNWANGLPVVPPLSLPISAGTVAQAVALNVPGKIKYINDGENPIY